MVTSISPTSGAVAGGSSITIVGTGFKRGAYAIFDGVLVTGRFDTRDVVLTTMYLESPPHAAGTIDVLVGNGDASSRVAFTIENNKLVSAICFGASGEIVQVALAAAVPVVDSEFSFSFADGSGMSGRMVAATEMVGSMNVGPCTDMTWRTYPPAEKPSGQ